MDIESFDRQKKMLKLREELLAVEEARRNGETGYSIEETVAMLKQAIEDATSEK